MPLSRKSLSLFGKKWDSLPLGQILHHVIRKRQKQRVIIWSELKATKRWMHYKLPTKLLEILEGHYRCVWPTILPLLVKAWRFCAIASFREFNCWQYSSEWRAALSERFFANPTKHTMKAFWLSVLLRGRLCRLTALLPWPLLFDNAVSFHHQSPSASEMDQFQHRLVDENSLHEVFLINSASTLAFSKWFQTGFCHFDKSKSTYRTRDAEH